MIDWDNVHAAISSWVIDGTGVKFIWAKQNGPRPREIYISAGLTVTPAGKDWVDVEVATFPASGAEIQHIARGPRKATLVLDCFGAVQYTQTSPMLVLETLCGKGRLPTGQGILRAGNVALSSFGDVLDLDFIQNTTKFTPRARLTVTLNLVSEISETGTNITSVEVTNQMPDPDTDFTIG